MASVAVMVGLAAIAGGVLWKQASFSPAVTELPGAGGNGGAGVSSGLFSRLPDGLAPMAAPESFDRESLSDKIDGRAELYLSAGFVGLKTQRIRAAAGPDTWFEVFIYDMGDARNAFSVFSTQRREGVPDAGFVAHGYWTENSVCLAHGRRYVEIVASRPGKAAMAAVEALARRIVEEAGPAAGEDVLADGGLLPKEGMIPGSLELTAANAFGFGRFDHIFSARYRDAGSAATMFLSRRSSPREAAELAGAWRAFLEGLDGKVQPAPAGTWLIEVDGAVEGAFAAGRILAGVHQAESAESAARMISRLKAAVEGRGK